MSTSIQHSNGMALTEVPPPTRPTLNVVLGLLGTWKLSTLAMARPIAWIGLAMPKAPKLNHFRQDALDAIKQVKWMPEWGQERISNMIAVRPDRCISGQRVWGVPIKIA